MLTIAALVGSLAVPLPADRSPASLCVGDAAAPAAPAVPAVALGAALTVSADELSAVDPTVELADALTVSAPATGAVDLTVELADALTLSADELPSGDGQLAEVSDALPLFDVQRGDLGGSAPQAPLPAVSGAVDAAAGREALSAAPSPLPIQVRVEVTETVDGLTVTRVTVS